MDIGDWKTRIIGIRNQKIGMATHNELGKKGEQLAVDFLENHGYDILERNYRFDKAEVDIIARKNHIPRILLNQSK